MTAGDTERTDPADQLLDVLALVLLLVNAVVLALLELFFLPLYIGSVPAPVSIVAAAVTTPWLVSRTGRVATKMGGSRWTAAIPLVLWLVIVVGMGSSGPGGDLLLVADWRGLALIAAGSVPGAIALGWTLGRPR